MDFWVFLSRVSDAIGIIGIFTLMSSGYAAYRLWKQNKQLKEMLKASPPSVENFKEFVKINEGVKSLNPHALVISLTKDGSVKKSVDAFLKENVREMTIEEVAMNGIKDQDDIEKFINEVKQKKQYFNAVGCTELHLFIAGPVIMGTMVGAILDTWIPVKLYHKPTPAQTPLYQYWGPLIG